MPPGDINVVVISPAGFSFPEFKVEVVVEEVVDELEEIVVDEEGIMIRHPVTEQQQTRLHKCSKTVGVELLAWQTPLDTCGAVGGIQGAGIRTCDRRSGVDLAHLSQHGKELVVCVEGDHGRNVH